MSGRGQTGHNQMLKRRRVKQLAKKRLIQAAKKAEKLRKQNARMKPPAA
ncbi:MAG: hypothetical protein HYY78_17120 [Betaproteobacteria bacterium]|nr:hypothetical protein [Betaproteobacteria bacterium]